MFGMGGNSSQSLLEPSGGGSGYFGGGGASVVYGKHGSGAGGSSYVSGCDGCVSVSKDYSFENNNTFIGPVHYSGLSFKNIRMLSGSEQLPSFNVSMTNQYVTYEQGHLGDGAFKITLLEHFSICSLKLNLYCFSYFQFFLLNLPSIFLS
ncbi:hypothetical protein TVAG_333070 [Trichomonas vaginalis G3]|uniref:receptor protein-tyrosine kinase n=1 Tax=Trichomonas vaginalis (strain ATCC PRA-98 / G3) TaxID=412133 RepID=A2EHA3_TRIV3|nr:glycine-rich protein family [Trichomonas vaginalis G3]EAY07982.1 hypothetical protein TVAG_333070 [Trichomonas vaginalis G3]KAI5486028.1 glycine-rich protein family [Trichomonas vaginalis G3]|eukprot:XP_001320205.1 hypothetical protein [Trichomonas vaginalis G3]